MKIMTLDFLRALYSAYLKLRDLFFNTSLLTCWKKDINSVKSYKYLGKSWFCNKFSNADKDKCGFEVCWKFKKKLSTLK